MATLRDVAKSAKVSLSTASVVLNEGKSAIPVSADTRERVKAAARNLGYEPNLFARSLRRRQSQTIGVALSYIVDPFSSAVIEGINNVLRAHSYSLLLIVLQDDPDPYATVQAMTKQRMLDGLLFTGSTPRLSDENLLALHQNGTKFVTIGRKVANSAIPAVVIDNRKGGKMAAEHLLSLGYTSFGLIGFNYPVGKERSDGFRATLRSAGPHSLREAVIQEVVPGTLCRAGYQAMTELLRRETRPRAVFASSDMFAIGAISAALANGLRVPDDVAVVGFDDMAEISEFFNPSLTTIRQPKHEMGRAGAEKLLSLLNVGPAKDSLNDTVLEPDLVIRHSCGSQLN